MLQEVRQRNECILEEEKETFFGRVKGMSIRWFIKQGEQKLMYINADVLTGKKVGIKRLY